MHLHWQELQQFKSLNLDWTHWDTISVQPVIPATGF